MNCQEIETRFADYCAGALTASERAAVEEHIATCAVCARVAETWNLLEGVPAPEPRPAMRERFHAMLHDASPRRRQWSFAPAWSMTAVAAALAIGWLGGSRWTAPGVSDPAGLRTEVAQLRQLVALSLLDQQSAGQRLRGIDYSYRVRRDDSEVLEALLHALSHDQNVNVRLSAVDAVGNFAANPEARRGLLQALDRQSSPLVQIAIVDQLAGLRYGEAAARLRKLSADSSADPSLRRRAAEAVAQLER